MRFLAYSFPNDGSVANPIGDRPHEHGIGARRVCPRGNAKDLPILATDPFKGTQGA